MVYAFLSGFDGPECRINPPMTNPLSQFHFLSNEVLVINTKDAVHVYKLSGEEFVRVGKVDL
jgi:hypothetical protein